MRHGGTVHIGMHNKAVPEAPGAPHAKGTRMFVDPLD